VIERLRRLVPTADRDAGYWVELLRADASRVADGLDGLWDRMQDETLRPVENPGGMLTKWLQNPDWQRGNEENGEDEVLY
jgi:hypothetical protein